MDTNKTKLKYVYEFNKIKRLLATAFNKRKSVKIKYCSLSSDETKYREISIYSISSDFVVAYCHLRKEIRTFITKRIISAAILSKDYDIPNNFNSRRYVR